MSNIRHCPKNKLTCQNSFSILHEKRHKIYYTTSIFYIKKHIKYILHHFTFLPNFFKYLRNVPDLLDYLLINRTFTLKVRNVVK